jgi:glycosyltransferase involved in cell wall biosynthesis
VRILVVSDLFPPASRGGYEVECKGVVEHLRGDHDVDVLTSVLGRRSEREPGVHRVLPFVGSDRRPFRSALAAWDASRAVRATDRALARVRPELVYVFNGSGLPRVVLRRLALSGTPMAVRVCEHWFGGLYANDRFLRHLTPGETGLRGTWARGMRAVARLDPRLDLDVRTPTRWAVSWNSRFLREAVRVPEEVEVVHEEVFLPVNPRVPRFADIERTTPAVPPTLFFAGRLDDRKGADVAVRALAALRDRHGVEARLVLAGHGTRPERASLAALIAELGLGARVELPGPLAFEEMAERLADCSAWVVPSVWNEPAPTVALEAGLARVPAVLARVGGAPEMLREETEALFFARGDHEGCADALARLLADEHATAERVTRAHARASAVSWPAYLQATDRFLAAAVDALRAG